MTDRSLAYFRAGKSDKAAVDIAAAIALNPAFAPSYWVRAALRLRNDQVEQALADLDQAIRLDPRFIRLPRPRIGSREQRPTGRAFNDYKEAIELNPKFVEAYLDRGALYEKTGKLDQAIADYTQAIHFAPTFSLAHYNLGNTYRAKHEYDSAIAQYSEAIRLNPGLAQAFTDRGIVTRRALTSFRRLERFVMP